MAEGAASSRSEFLWGERVPGLENSYQSMRFRGFWYSLYDCVHVRSDKEDPHVGKLMRLYEEDGKRKMRVRWFFRGYELPQSVAKDVSRKNKQELFVGQGSIKGVENVNLVDTIVRKVTVLCTAKVAGNPLPCLQQVEEAHYFNRVYDAAQRKLVKMDRIDKALASKLFNKPEWVLPPVVPPVVPPAVESATWEDIKSPTSVTDFAMVARKRASPNAEGSGGIMETEFKKFKGGS